MKHLNWENVQNKNGDFDFGYVKDIKTCLRLKWYSQCLVELCIIALPKATWELLYLDSLSASMHWAQCKEACKSKDSSASCVQTDVLAFFFILTHTHVPGFTGGNTLHVLTSVSHSLHFFPMLTTTSKPAGVLKVTHLCSVFISFSSLL